jgi:competence protein ComEA
MKYTKRMVTAIIVLALVVTCGLATAKTKKAMSGVVNINTAGLAELMLLPGVGQSKAQAIVDYRKDHPFQKSDDLKAVKGIGEKRLASIAPYITVSGPSTATAGAALRGPSGGQASQTAPKAAPGTAGKAF